MQFRLFVADDFRPLADGKTLAVGLFADSVVILHASQAVIEQSTAGVPLVTTLGFLACVTGIEPGEHKFSLSFHAPDGAALPYRLDMSRRVGEDGSANIVVNVQMFEVRTGGAYTVQIAVDDGEPMRETVTLRLKPIAAPAPPAPSKPQ